MTEKDELRAAQEGKEPYLYGDLLAVAPDRLSIFHQTSGTTESRSTYQILMKAGNGLWRSWCYILYAAGFVQRTEFFCLRLNVYIAFWQGHYAAEK